MTVAKVEKFGKPEVKGNYKTSLRAQRKRKSCLQRLIRVSGKRCGGRDDRDCFFVSQRNGILEVLGNGDNPFTFPFDIKCSTLLGRSLSNPTSLALSF